MNALSGHCFSMSKLGMQKIIITENLVIYKLFDKLGPKLNSARMNIY